MTNSTFGHLFGTFWAPWRRFRPIGAPGSEKGQKRTQKVSKTDPHRAKTTFSSKVPRSCSGERLAGFWERHNQKKGYPHLYHHRSLPARGRFLGELFAIPTLQVLRGAAMPRRRRLQCIIYRIFTLYLGYLYYIYDMCIIFCHICLIFRYICLRFRYICIIFKIFILYLGIFVL